MKFAVTFLLVAVLSVGYSVKQECPFNMRWCHDECIDQEAVCEPYAIPIKYIVDHHGCELTKSEVWCVEKEKCLTLYNNHCAQPMCEPPHSYCKYKRMCVVDGFGEKCE